MEHIVQFAISIDDDTITKHVEERAEKVIIDDIRKKVENAFFAKSYYGNPTNDPGTWSERLFIDFLDEHKAEILECAAKYLAEKLAKTKAGRELLNGAKPEGET